MNRGRGQRLVKRVRLFQDGEDGIKTEEKGRDLTLTHPLSHSQYDYVTLHMKTTLMI